MAELIRAAPWHSHGPSASIRPAAPAVLRLAVCAALPRGDGIDPATLGVGVRRRRPLGSVRSTDPAGVRGAGGSALIFKAVREGRPYPDHGFSTRDWAMIPPRQVRLDTLVTTRRELALDALLADDSTFYGDLFPHVVEYQGSLYLEDGLHRALRAALQQRNSLHVRVLSLDGDDEDVEQG